MKKRHLALLLLLSLLLQSVPCLSACGKDEPGTESQSGETEPAEDTRTLASLLDGNGASLFTVVRPEDASESLKKSVTAFKRNLSAVLGADVPFTDDWIGRGADIEKETAANYEILIGETNRPASARAKEELKPNSYVIRLDGNKLVILGTTDALTAYAAEGFLKHFQTNGEYAKMENPVFTSAMEKAEVYDPAKGSLDGKYYVSLLGGYYKTEGRTFLQDDGLALLYSAASFEINARCKGDVKITMVSDSVGDGDDWAVYFTAYVDQKRMPERFKVSNGVTELTVATGLEEGEHNIALYRQTEWDRGNTHVNAVELDGTILPLPEDKPLYIEFVGDSLTSGFGNLSDIPTAGRWGGAPILQDATQSYGFITAKNLNADMSIVAIQGIGCVCGPQTITMNGVYRSFPFCSDSKFTYDFPRKADIVVINMGTNDYETYGGRGIRVATIMEACTELAKMVREANPGCKIVWATGMQPSFTTELKSVISKLGGADEGYYYLKLKQSMNGHESHTDVKGHEENAQILTEFLRTIIDG